MTDLLPCPFCGGNARKSEGLNEHWISCMSCQASSIMRSNIDAAISAWNTRAQPEYLSGCLHPSEFGCQFYGKCLSVACNHYGKEIKT